MGRCRPRARMNAAGVFREQLGGKGYAFCAVAVGLSAIVAFGAVWAPSLLAAIVLLVMSFAIGMLPTELSGRLCLALVGVLLAGYAFLGRSFAYIGVPPLYVGEITLFVATLIGLVNGGIGRVRLSRVVWLLAAFAAWCTARTAPFLSLYGFDALRDAVVWGYSLFALVVAASIATGNALKSIIRWYSLFIPLFLSWIFSSALLRYLLPDLQLPTGPAGISPLALKPGDVAVHLAGISAFVVLGLGSSMSYPNVAWVRTSLFWLLITCAVLFYGSQNRGGLLAFLAAAVVLVPFSRGRGWAKPAACMGALSFVLLATGQEIDVGLPRKISLQQIAENIRSIGGSGHPIFEGTRQWRLAWWSRIVDYAALGAHRWTGKGFGVNLADDDGFQTSPTHSLRSPHSVHLGILARTGLPGLALWLGLQLTFGASLLSCIRRNCPAHPHGNTLAKWVLVYWIAALVNASFDVYLEGPAGGIWFWSIFGLGLFLTQHRCQACSDAPERKVKGVFDDVILPQNKSTTNALCMWSARSPSFPIYKSLRAHESEQ